MLQSFVLVSAKNHYTALVKESYSALKAETLFQTLADLLPLTLSCELARNFVQGGVFRPVAGIFVPVIWTAVFCFLSVMLLKRRLKMR